jgi:hypothetical protein
MKENSVSSFHIHSQFISHHHTDAAEITVVPDGVRLASCDTLLDGRVNGTSGRPAVGREGDDGAIWHDVSSTIVDGIGFHQHTLCRLLCFDPQIAGSEATNCSAR